ncbi:hypothetical protein ACFM35_03275 [Microbacterium sp. P01]|uniref:hypothetical protein n=1 Tax=Microbacterium sp. P01 TaxID=3366261 RepID=UPI00366C6DB6
MSDQDPAVPSPPPASTAPPMPPTPPAPPSVPPTPPAGHPHGTPAYSAPAAPGYAAPGYAEPGYAAPVSSAPGYAAPGYAAPGYAAPGYAAQNPGAPAFAAPYSAPSGGAFRPEPTPAGSATLGIVALIAATAALVLCTVVGAIATADIGAGVAPQLTSTMSSSSWDWSILSSVRGSVLLVEVAFWVGTALGIWGIVQGIFATVKRRGRGYGIAAIAVGVIAPVVFSVTLYIVFFVALAGEAAKLGLMT